MLKGRITVRFLFGLLLVVLPLACPSAQGQTDADLTPEKLKEVERLFRNQDPSGIEPFNQASALPILFVMHLGRLGVYPMPKDGQGMLQVSRWPAPEIKDSFKIEFPLVFRATLESRDGTYPQRVLILRQENQNSPWVVIDHYLPAKDGSVKEKQAIPPPVLQAKARAAATAELEKNKECNNEKQ